MKNKKEGLFIQCIICSLLPLLALFIPYLKFSISIMGQKGYIKSLTGIDLLKLMGNVNSLVDPSLEQYFGSDFFSSMKIYIILMVFVIFIIPLLLFIASAVMHILAMKDGYFTKMLTVMPGLALIFSVGGMLLCQSVVKAKIQDSISSAIEEVMNSVGGGLLNGIAGIVGDMAGNSISSAVKFQGGIAFWFFVIMALVLIVEDFVLSSKEGMTGQMQMSDPFVEDAIYVQQREKSSASLQTPKHLESTRNDSKAAKNLIYTRVPGDAKQQSSDISSQDNTMMKTGEITQKSQVPSGMLIGIRGEYEGAQIQIFNRERIYIGRSSEANLVLSNKKASRKHCSIMYDAKEDKYSIVNYSSNGTYLNGGQLLEKEKTYHLPHGTTFLVTKEDEFKVL